MKVSVIIPVYNAERYLRRCIESLLAQTLAACEFLFVNDGSEDGSAAVIADYMRRDARVRLISQANQGVSMARNAGLEAACGEYIGFMDADDVVEPDMFERLYEAAAESGCDVVISNYETEMEGRRVVTTYPFPQGAPQGRNVIERWVLPYFMEHDNMNAVWNKLYRAEAVRAYGVRFPKRVALGEDGLFNLRFFARAQRMRYIDYAGYHYLEAAGSATRDMTKHDYFAQAVSAYTSEWPDGAAGVVDPGRMRTLRAIKLVNSALSLAYQYAATPASGAGFYRRYRLIRRIVRNTELRGALSAYDDEAYRKLGRYQRFVLDMMRRRFTPAVYAAVTYSRIRNR
ncbi:glycosyltransferase family 2 protein [Paenibacillus aurantiacus]|uniref:Glycosyltransferase family 2 protein n=1 Tax=Paenibacillus aurantiacus TaxID=1936118 RepID=A0ABV5KIK8_9BACL